MRGLALLLLALTGCASSGGVKAQQQPEEAAAADVVTTVRVSNRRRAEFDVYVVARAQRVLLGQLPPLGSRTFTLPPSLLSESPRLRFQFEPVGASGVLDGGEMPVSPGDQVELVIPR